MAIPGVYHVSSDTGDTAWRKNIKNHVSMLNDILLSVTQYESQEQCNHISKWVSTVVTQCDIDRMNCWLAVII